MVTQSDRPLAQAADFAAAEQELARAWRNPEYTQIELAPLDVNRVLQEAYSVGQPLTFTRAILWDVEGRFPVGQRLDHLGEVRAGGLSARSSRILTADFAGVAFARKVRSDPGLLARLQDGFRVEDYVPEITGLREGLAFMTLHFQDEVPTNELTIDATDPKSGTAEFKATAIRVEKLAVVAEEPAPAG